MSPIAITLDLLLVGLLVLALATGWRLERRLKALRDGQAGFADAVAELDRAARRAELGLAALRTATDEALELLVGRIDKARDLSGKLEQLTADGGKLLDRAQSFAAPARPSTRAAPAATPSPQLAALERQWPRAVDAAAAQSREAVDSGDLDAVAEAVAENLILKLSRADVIGPEPVRAPLRPARASARSRAAIDDELFETPANLRAGPGGRI